MERKVSQRRPKGIPACPNMFLKMFLKILDIPRLLGCMSQTGPKSRGFSKTSQTVSHQNSQNYGFPRRPKGHSQPPPKINGITNMSQTDFSNNDVQSDTVSPCGPRGSNSNVVQRSSNNDGNACTNHAVNNIASAECYCGKLYGTYVENSGVGGSVPVWGQWKARACLCIAQGLRV